MFVDILNDWRRLLLLKEEQFSLCHIFALCPRELKLSEMPIVPLFMRTDEKRWCQASVLKGGRSFCPLFSLAGKSGNQDWGQNKK
jgi:hypothetical protein